MKNKKICLSLETSSSRLGVGLFYFENGCVERANQFFKNTGAKQSDLLIPTVNRLMNQSGISKRNLSLVAVNVGPGSFTGIRVGVSTARALAQSLGCAVVGVCGLEAMAWSVSQHSKANLFVSCMPALQGEIYFAVYSQGKDSSLRVRQRPAWKKNEDFEELLRKLSLKRLEVAVIVASWRDDLTMIKNRFPKIRWVPKPIVPDPGALANLAVSIFSKGSGRLHYEKVVPLYLQPSWAERNRNANVNRK